MVAAAWRSTTPGVRRGAAVSLRWVLVHMIEEYARHNGHADFLRERIDGPPATDRASMRAWQSAPVSRLA